MESPQKSRKFAITLEKNEVHIFLLTEMKARCNFVFNLRGYTVQERHGNNGHGSVAIAAREDVAYQSIADHPALRGIETTAIRLANNTVVVVYYNSPSKKLLAGQLNGLVRMPRKVVIVGDLNATHTS
ncbi:hypothetical protein AMK59_3176 [Oryctes borbonicus]|uniref:Endonuclease/exonuclease/phosphatase domain-containing protein n=1 Tax=Oryctes borbonicus TaxID=1629725 RepID=A0A0T6B3U2_9SCAR|nr:hypothetical protein AMK59_3176 [Oryctes borbonicus]